MRHVHVVDEAVMCPQYMRTETEGDNRLLTYTVHKYVYIRSTSFSQTKKDLGPTRPIYLSPPLSDIHTSNIIKANPDRAYSRETHLRHGHPHPT